MQTFTLADASGDEFTVDVIKDKNEITLHTNGKSYITINFEALVELMYLCLTHDARETPPKQQGRL